MAENYGRYIVHKVRQSQGKDAALFVFTKGQKQSPQRGWHRWDHPWNKTGWKRKESAIIAVRQGYWGTAFGKPESELLQTPIRCFLPHILAYLMISGGAGQLGDEAAWEGDRVQVWVPVSTGGKQTEHEAQSPPLSLYCCISRASTGLHTCMQDVDNKREGRTRNEEFKNKIKQRSPLLCLFHSSQLLFHVKQLLSKDFWKELSND